MLRVVGRHRAARHLPADPQDRLAQADPASRPRCPPRAPRRPRARSASGTAARPRRRRRARRRAHRAIHPSRASPDAHVGCRRPDRSGRSGPARPRNAPSVSPSGPSTIWPIPTRPWIGASIGSPSRTSSSHTVPFGNVNRRTVASGFVQAPTWTISPRITWSSSRPPIVDDEEAPVLGDAERTQHDLVARLEPEAPDRRDVQSGDVRHAPMLPDDDIADLQHGARTRASDVKLEDMPANAFDAVERGRSSSGMVCRSRLDVDGFDPADRLCSRARSRRARFVEHGSRAVVTRAVREARLAELDLIVADVVESGSMIVRRPEVEPRRGCLGEGGKWLSAPVWWGAPSGQGRPCGRAARSRTRLCVETSARPCRRPLGMPPHIFASCARPVRQRDPDVDVPGTARAPRPPSVGGGSGTIGPGRDVVPRAADSAGRRVASSPRQRCVLNTSAQGCGCHGGASPTTVPSRRQAATTASAAAATTRPHIRKTPNRVSGIGAWSAASMPIVRTRRVSSGSMTPSSHSRAVAK